MQTVSFTNQVKCIFHWCLDICRLLLAIIQGKQPERGLRCYWFHITNISLYISLKSSVVNSSLTRKSSQVCLFLFSAVKADPTMLKRKVLAVWYGKSALTSWVSAEQREVAAGGLRDAKEGGAWLSAGVAKCQCFILMGSQPHREVIEAKLKMYQFSVYAKLCIFTIWWLVLPATLFIIWRTGLNLVFLISKNRKGIYGIDRVKWLTNVKLGFPYWWLLVKPDKE